MIIDKLLEQLDACEEARKWAKGKSWEEIYETCHRGDWLLWLFAKTNPDNLKELTLVKGHCVNTIRHLMKDKRSIKAIDTAIAFGEGKATRDELDAAASAAYAASAAAYTAAYAAASSASSASAAAYTAAYATAYAAYAAAYTASAAYTSDARTKNRLETANICRKYLPISVWNVKEQEK